MQVALPSIIVVEPSPVIGAWLLIADFRALRTRKCAFISPYAIHKFFSAFATVTHIVSNYVVVFMALRVSSNFTRFDTAFRQ